MEHIYTNRGEWPLECLGSVFTVITALILSKCILMKMLENKHLANVYGIQLERIHVLHC